MSDMGLGNLLFCVPRPAPLERGSSRSRAVVRMMRNASLGSQLCEVSRSLCARSSCATHLTTHVPWLKENCSCTAISILIFPKNEKKQKI